jgi:hypothetical protein
MMPKNLAGIEETATPASDLAEADQVPQPAQMAVAEPKTKKTWLIIALLALALLAGVGGYVCFIQAKLTTLKKELQQQRALIAAADMKTGKALDTATNAIVRGQETASKLSVLESRVEGKTKSYDDYLNKTLPTELKKLPQFDARALRLESSLSSSTQGLSNQLLEVQQVIQSNDSRVGIVIQVLKSQDRVLRAIIPEKKNQ